MLWKDKRNKQNWNPLTQVKERWEWLGLDLRGPFPPTVNKHTHIMTLTDYHSKWVEAFPLTDKLSKDVAACLTDVIRQQGYPLGILSRLPKGTIVEVRDTNALFNTVVLKNCSFSSYFPLCVCVFILFFRLIEN